MVFGVLAGGSPDRPVWPSNSIPDNPGHGVSLSFSLQSFSDQLDLVAEWVYEMANEAVVVLQRTILERQAKTDQHATADLNTPCSLSIWQGQRLNIPDRLGYATSCLGGGLLGGSSIIHHWLPQSVHYAVMAAGAGYRERH
ncbi:hypothetical protein EYZ11_010313 [Aspergillus tanneri]|uniref:Uncharacterized protein n=1 Tax=Aspergillus tanneri TaxID=1220188 RepID=A0A4S3J681_9EURO|nr:uncharacterized protein ATNIH1004_002369 [Aspergillus tanneri]KAA8649696.1 hypothetical protein ATNIH1004_002369 [Aspergillus tanneri]THC90232.1 hypothetical protein EYZ11_010313 [Aspergillus tanneri]